jgi:TatD DNase family protein
LLPAGFDTHCHLQDPRLAPDLPRVLARARAAGVTRMVCCATREQDWAAVLELRRRHPGIGVMLGLHPWHVAEATPGWLDRLEAHLLTQSAGLGECGLDFRPNHPDPALQEQALIAQLRLAIRLDRPVSLHCVRAWGPLRACLERTGIPAAGAVLHAFAGSVERARVFTDLGLHLGFGGAIADPAAHRARASLAAVAADRILFETDAPDLPPPGWEGPNEPASLAWVVAAAQAIRGAPVAAQAQANAQRLFGRI